MKKGRAVVVFSGGQDSTTCLIKSLAEYEEVYALSFFYAQKHWNELEKAKEITKKFNVPHKIMNVETLFSMLDNCALTQLGMEFKQGEKYPNTFVDGRNHIFLSVAAIYAKQKDCHTIITGCGQADYSGYPDCRREFIDSLERTLSLAMDYQFTIETPLMYLTKKDTWKLADELGYLDFVRDHTLTCYNGIPGGCHECPACKLREQGYNEYMQEKEGTNV